MEMDGDSEKDKATLDALLSSLLTDLLQLSGDVGAMAVRTPRHEVELVVLRLLSVLMSRARSSNKSTSEVLLRALLWLVTVVCIAGVCKYCDSKGWKSQAIKCWSPIVGQTTWAEPFILTRLGRSPLRSLFLARDRGLTCSPAAGMIHPSTRLLLNWQDLTFSDASWILGHYWRFPGLSYADDHCQYLLWAPSDRQSTHTTAIAKGRATLNGVTLKA